MTESYNVGILPKPGREVPAGSDTIERKLESPICVLALRRRCADLDLYPWQQISHASI